MALILIAFVVIGAGCTATESESVVVDKAQEDPKEEIIIEEESMTYAFPGVLDADRIENKIVTISTEKGDVTFELFADTAPKAVSNFVYLAEQGYYDGLIFHRLVPGFVVQGGDPTGSGYGGPGYQFEDEVDDEYTYERGIVAMANSGPDTNGSQFFIMLADNPLPKAYSIFGRVLEGMEVVDELVEQDVMTKVAVSPAGESK